MPDFNWKNIISYKGSQNNAFEELVCHIACEEEIPNRISSDRVGNPDGGVEAYCTLKDGDEYGWQAKFFDSMGQSQWAQLDESFKKAFEKHPRLVRYYVCIPLDRPDPRIPNQNWFMDRWNEKVEQWKEYAAKQRRNIEFEYWGSSELLNRLTLEKHAGRRKFWFNEIDLSERWFSNRINRSIEDLGKRYTPQLNFELEIAKIFDFIARDEHFQKQIYNTYDDILKKLSEAINAIRDKDISEYRAKLQQDLDRLRNTYEKIDFDGIMPVDIECILSICNAMKGHISSLESYIYGWQSSKEKHNKDNPANKFDYLLNQLRKSTMSLFDFRKFIEDPKMKLTNIPALILQGNAGVGKSHLIADVARKRAEEGKHSVLLLGQHFVNNENPWTQILRNILRLDCNEDEFLGALNAKAQSSGSRIIIFIDAINEGNGLHFWPDHIKSFINSFKSYKWIGIVLSIRSSYVKKIAPTDLITDDLVVLIEHYGFRDVEYEASKHFFKEYGIVQPSIPLLYPDFQNPLYLKLFCEGLSRKGFTEIPDGYEGITKIIDFYLEAINDQLSRANRFNYSDSINLVKKAIQLIAQRKVEQNLNFVRYEEAYDLLEQECGKYLNNRGFLDALISEGVFAKNLYWDKNGQDTEGIYLTYQKFEDHIITSYLLGKHLDHANPEDTFTEDQVLHKLLKDENECYYNSGIVQALSVQIPELTGKELFEIAPHCKAYAPIIDAFLESLIWRKKETISTKLIDYINEYVLGYDHDRFLETVLSVASIPKHPFNADFLHKNLMKNPLPDRDALWTIYIHHQIYEPTPVKRLIDWAWSSEDKSHISDESILLSAKAISWFLTSCNRFLRDSATKALIAILENRIEVLIELLKDFEDVNDPYIYERLFAVAYGCTLRSQNRNGLKQLAEYVYKVIFNKEYVYPHILLRDYARGVIEYSLHLGLDINVDKQKIRPPYQSDWFDNIPTNDEIKQYRFDYKDPNFKDYYWGQNTIISSMQPEYSKICMYGDFGRYVFQSGFSHWDLNVQELSNLAIKRVFELGYDVEKHGEFDRNINRHFNYGRAGKKPERIGKKYQWIAFYELLARVSDNFVMYEDTYSRDKKKSKYDGPWEPYVRDIDPTILIKRTGGDEVYQADAWWFKTQYEDWSGSYEEWIKKTNDLPEPAKIIEVNDHQRNKWFALEVYPSWEEPVEIGQDKYEHIHKYIWYKIKSYIAKEEDYEKIVNLCKEQHFMGKWMPESRDLYELYSREYFWSPAYSSFHNPYYYGETWRDISERRSDSEIGKVMIPTEGYLWEEEYDCSKNDVISFFKPSLMLFEGLNMRFGSAEGELVNEEGECICFDPSVNYRSPTCLIIRKDDILSFLQKNKLKIFWTVLGEKWVRGFGFSGEYPDEKLEFSGVYTLDKEEVNGNLTFFSEGNRGKNL